MLSVADKICESNEVIIRVIKASGTVDFDPAPAKLRTNAPSRNEFFPQKKDGKYLDCLSFVHEDGRTIEVISSIARTIPGRPAKYLAKVAVKHIAELREQNPQEPLLALNISRNDIGYDGHSDMFSFPNDADAIAKIANQLTRIMRQNGEIEEISNV